MPYSARGLSVVGLKPDALRRRVVLVVLVVVCWSLTELVGSPCGQAVREIGWISLVPSGSGRGLRCREIRSSPEGTASGKRERIREIS